MSLDEMYMENLDEFVNDENKVVTFKWLSTNLKVHVNQAKQMLYAFVQQERNKKENDKLSVTYFVAGTPKNKNGCVGHQCTVVPEEDLEAIKSTFASVTSCHIYSVQKVKLKNSGTLYITDYDNTKEKIFECSRYSAISCTKAKARSKEELAKLGVRLTPSHSSEKKNESTSVSKSAANGTSSTKVKAEPKGSIANMFASGGSKKNVTEKSTDEKSKEETKEKPKQTKGGKSGGVMSFFSKQTEKPKQAENIESKKPDVKKEPELPTMKENKTDTKKGRQSKGKKSTRVSDSDEEDKPDKKRRKRIRNDLFDSSSSEDEMDILEESPVPSPVREPSPAPESPIHKETPKPESDEDVTVVSQTNGSQKRRKRTRKLVPKTFMDDDGFMVTEKVWESDSTDASEKEEEKKAPSPVKQSKPQANKKTSPHKKSPAKGGTKNQMSLTSFFKKK